ncbi:MAG: hypothetical protein WC773_02115 [Patescibacteria group bacterium]|jgi:hypothetical protein
MTDQVLDERFQAMKTLFTQLPELVEYLARKGSIHSQQVCQAITGKPDYRTALDNADDPWMLASFLRVEMDTEVLRLIKQYLNDHPQKWLLVYARPACTTVLCPYKAESMYAVLYRSLSEMVDGGVVGLDATQVIRSILCDHDQHDARRSSYMLGAAAVIVDLTEQLCRAKAELAALRDTHDPAGQKQTQCMFCPDTAVWERHTQFTGIHPFCQKHAELESDFGKDGVDNFFWVRVEEVSTEETWSI